MSRILYADPISQKIIGLYNLYLYHVNFFRQNSEYERSLCDCIGVGIKMLYLEWVDVTLPLCDRILVSKCYIWNDLILDFRWSDSINSNPQAEIDTESLRTRHFGTNINNKELQANLLLIDEVQNSAFSIINLLLLSKFVIDETVHSPNKLPTNNNK